jgi:hypothetical protein
VRLATAVLVLVVSLAGCSGTGIAAGRGTAASTAMARSAPMTAPTATPKAAPTAAPTAAPKAGPTAGPAVFCQARPAGALADALSRVVPGSSTGELIPLGAAPDGRTAYVAAWTQSFSGVAALDLASGRLLPISPFPDPASDQADGVSAGPWLVWSQTRSLSDLDAFTVYAWNAQTRRLRVIGRSLAGPAGTPWPSPWHAPAVSGNYAAWAQGYGPGGLVEIRLANLASGAVTTIRRGHVQAPFFDGTLLAWPESDTPGSETSLHAYSVVTHAAAALPAALAAVHGTDFVVSDGTRTAYLSPDFGALYYSPAQDMPARLRLRLPPGEDFTGLALAPGTLAWTTTTATYLASTTTGAFMQVTPRYGDATGSGSVVLVSDAPSQPQSASQEAHPPLVTHVIDPAAISWPDC